jgi:hypothetical protein
MVKVKCKVAEDANPRVLARVRLWRGETLVVSRQEGELREGTGCTVYTTLSSCESV